MNWNQDFNNIMVVHKVWLHMRYYKVENGNGKGYMES